MWIINGVVSGFSNSFSWFRGTCGTETSRLVDERSFELYGGEDMAPPLSFSHGYTPFQDSKEGLRLWLFHFVFFLFLGAIGFSYVFETWSLIDSLYFSTVTFTTIGYGDLSPTTDAGRLFTVFFAIYGIGILSALIGMIGNAVVDTGQNAMQEANRRAKKKLLSMFSTSDAPGDHSDEDSGLPLWREFLNVAILESPMVLVLIIVSCLLGISEGRSVITSIYFVVITSTTIGFGDTHPTTPTNRLICIFFLPFAVAVFGEALSRIAGVYMKRKARETEKTFLQRQLTLCDLQAMDDSHDNKVDYGEFLSFMLVALEKVEKDEVYEIKALFDSLDKDKNGYLEKDDLLRLTTSRKSQILRRHQVAASAPAGMSV